MQMTDSEHMSAACGEPRAEKRDGGARLRRQAWLLAVFVAVLAATLSPARSLQAQSPDLRGIVPYLMLVIDTSGSMEQLTSCSCTTPGCEECLPNCSLSNVSGVPPKSPPPN